MTARIRRGRADGDIAVMTRVCAHLPAFILVAGLLHAIACASSPVESLHVGRPVWEADESDDPAYALYRGGYRCILNEEWAGARKEFAELMRRYPESPYREEAEYWTAFSWKQDDAAKAREAYKAFIREHPSSPYFGDAIADFRMLEIEAALARVPQPPPSVAPPGHELRMRIPEEIRRFEKEILQLQLRTEDDHRQMMIIREGDTLLARAPAVPMRIRIFTPEANDPEMQMRLNALSAMLEGKRDNRGFNALRDIAVNPRQPAPIRHAALNALSEFSANDPSSVYLQIANTDTDESIQRIAIELFARNNRSKTNRSERLVELFHQYERSSPQREGALSTTLYALAAIGDDRATDFLAGVARNSRNQALRSDAIYYLGNLGTDRARQALFKIVKGE
jgi:hypothetical protein